MEEILDGREQELWSELRKFREQELLQTESWCGGSGMLERNYGISSWLLKKRICGGIPLMSGDGSSGLNL